MLTASPATGLMPVLMPTPDGARLPGKLSTRVLQCVFLRHCDVEPAIATFDGVRSPPDVVRLYPKTRYDYTLASAFLGTAASGYITSRRDNAPNKNTGHRYVYTTSILIAVVTSVDTQHRSPSRCFMAMGESYFLQDEKCVFW